MRCLLLFFAAACAAFAQLDTNVITVTASRQMNVPPDQAYIAVTFPAGDTQTLNLLSQSFPITNLTNTPGPGADQQQWAFTFVVAVQDLTKTISSLHAMASENKSISYYVQGTTTSAQASAAQQCPYPTLINDAREQAAKLATAAGMTLGQIVSMAQTNTATQSPGGVRSGGFVAFLTTIPNPYVATVSSIITSPIAASCSLTVQFALTQ